MLQFCFGRSLQPRGLAETLCGSPLYMAPEIMQMQKYDAKVIVTTHLKTSLLSSHTWNCCPLTLILICRQISGVSVLFYFSSLLGKLHSMETIKSRFDETFNFFFFCRKWSQRFLEVLTLDLQLMTSVEHVTIIVPLQFPWSFFLHPYLVLRSYSRTLWNQLSCISLWKAIIWLLIAKIYVKNCCVVIQVFHKFRLELTSEFWHI